MQVLRDHILKHCHAGECSQEVGVSGDRKCSVSFLSSNVGNVYVSTALDETLKAESRRILSAHPGGIRLPLPALTTCWCLRCPPSAPLAPTWLRHHHCAPRREANAIWLNPNTRIRGLFKLDTNLTLSIKMAGDKFGNVTILSETDFPQSPVQHHGERLCVRGLQRQTESGRKEREG